MRSFILQSLFLPFAFCLLIIITGFAFNSYAQEQKSKEISGNSSGTSIFKIGKNSPLGLRSMSLLDPERFTMKQQTIMSYSSSNRMGSGLQGMYLNTMEYRFSMPLTMRLRVAYQNNMGSLIGNKSSNGGKPGMETGNLYIPSFDMVYKPWKNTTISFHYRDYSGTNSNYYPGNRYRSRYGFYR